MSIEKTKLINRVTAAMNRIDKWEVMIDVLTQIDEPILLFESGIAVLNERIKTEKAFIDGVSRGLNMCGYYLNTSGGPDKVSIDLY